MYRRQVSGLTDKLNSPLIHSTTHACEPVKPHRKYTDTRRSNWQMIAAVTHNSQLTILNR